MLSGTALALSELPLELIAQHGLERRIHDRGGEREVQFLFADAERLLPVWRNGRLEILRWGNRRGESAAVALHGLDAVGHPRKRRLGRTWRRAGRHPGENGIGQGRVVSHPPGHAAWRFMTSGCPRVYVICEPSSHYYR